MGRRDTQVASIFSWVLPWLLQYWSSGFISRCALWYLDWIASGQDSARRERYSRALERAAGNCVGTGGMMTPVRTIAFMSNADREKLRGDPLERQCDTAGDLWVDCWPSYKWPPWQGQCHTEHSGNGETGSSSVDEQLKRGSITGLDIGCRVLRTDIPGIFYAAHKEIPLRPNTHLIRLPIPIFKHLAPRLIGSKMS